MRRVTCPSSPPNLPFLSSCRNAPRRTLQRRRRRRRGGRRLTSASVSVSLVVLLLLHCVTPGRRQAARHWVTSHGREVAATSGCNAVCATMVATMDQGTHVTLRSLRRRWPLTEDQSAPLSLHLPSFPPRIIRAKPLSGSSVADSRSPVDYNLVEIE